MSDDRDGNDFAGLGGCLTVFVVSIFLFVIDPGLAFTVGLYGGIASMAYVAIQNSD